MGFFRAEILVSLFIFSHCLMAADKGLRVPLMCANVIRQAAELGADGSTTPKPHGPKTGERGVRSLSVHESTFDPDAAVEDATESPDAALASAAIEPPAPKASEGGWVNERELDLAHKGLVKMWETVFGKEIVYEPLAGSDDRLMEKGKPVRGLVLARGSNVPRQVLRRWVRNSDLIERRAGRLRGRVTAAAQTLTDKKLDFEPLFFLRLVEIMRDVMRNAQIVGESRKYLEPLIRATHQNTHAYLRSLNQGALLDKDQAELMFHLEAMVLLGVLTPELVLAEIEIKAKDGQAHKFRPVLSAIEDVMACAMGPSTDALQPDTHATLIALVDSLGKAVDVMGEPFRHQSDDDWEIYTARGEIVDMNAKTYREALQNGLGAAMTKAATDGGTKLGVETLQTAVRTLRATLESNHTGEKELHSARKEFVSERTAAETAHDLLSAIVRRDQGRALVGYGNPLRDAWVTSLDAHPQLRSLIEAALDGQTTMRDPVLKQTVDFGMNPAEAAEIFGHGEIDPMLIGLYVRRAAVGRVQARAYPLALEAELDHLEKRLKEARLETGARILSAAAGSAVNHFETVYQRGVIPKEFWKALKQQISLDDGPSQIQVGPEGRRRQLPPSFVKFVEAISASLERAVSDDEKPARRAAEPKPAARGADDEDEAREVTKEEANEPETPAVPQGGNSSQLLAQWLIRLNTRALALQEQERQVLLTARTGALDKARKEIEKKADKADEPKRTPREIYRDEVAAARRKLEGALARLTLQKALLADAIHRLVWAVGESLWDPKKDPLAPKDDEQLRADAETTFLHHLYGCAPDLATFVAVDNTAGLDGLRRRMNDRELTVRFQRMNPTLWERWGSTFSMLGRNASRFRRVIAWSAGILLVSGIGWYTSDYWWPAVQRNLPWLRPGIEAPVNPGDTGAPPPTGPPGDKPPGDKPPKEEKAKKDGDGEEKPDKPPRSRRPDPDKDPDDPE